MGSHTGSGIEMICWEETDCVENEGAESWLDCVINELMLDEPPPLITWLSSSSLSSSTSHVHTSHVHILHVPLSDHVDGGGKSGWVMVIV